MNVTGFMQTKHHGVFRVFLLAETMVFDRDSCRLSPGIFPSGVWGVCPETMMLSVLGVFLAFLATGLCLETRSILRQITSVRAPIAAVLSSLVLYPVLAWLLSLPLLPYEFVIGVCIIGTGPVTVSSGTILTAIARGNVPLSILICISTSFLAIFTIPVILNLLLSVGTDIELPVLGMLNGTCAKSPRSHCHGPIAQTIS